MSDEVLIKVEGVRKKFCRSLRKSLWYGVTDMATEVVGGKGSHDALRDGEFWAVDNVSFELRRGECLGLIGYNGAGKTTLLKMLNGLIKPDHGRIEMHGRVGALIALGAGFNPILTGRENIYVNGSILGLTKREIDAKIDEIIDFAEIREFIDSPVQSYSSGMQVRLGFAVATAMNPDVLLLDEVLAVGDATFRSKCFKRIGALLSKCAVIFVSHDAYSVRRICDQVIWLKRGGMAFSGDTNEGMNAYGREATALAVGDSVRPFFNTADYITQVNCHATISRHADASGFQTIDIIVTIEFQSSQPTELGFRLGNIMAGEDDAIAQFEFAEWMPRIREGSNSFKFQIRQVQLAKGSYTLSLIVFDASNKHLLLNLRNFVVFEVHGNLRYGPRYALQTTAVVELSEPLVND